MPEIAIDEASRRLGQAMKAWRAEHNVTQERAGLSMGVDRVQWQKWENGVADGRNPTLESLLKIATVMQMPFPVLADLIWPRDQAISVEHSHDPHRAVPRRDGSAPTSSGNSSGSS